MRWIWILIAMLCLIAVGGIWYWYQIPRVHLDRSTPRKQNGLTLVELELREEYLKEYLYARVQVEQSEQAPLPKRIGRADLTVIGRPPKWEVSLVDSTGREYPEHTFLVRDLPNGFEMNLPLHHPPSIAYFDVHVKVDARTAHWRIIPPRPLHAVKKPNVINEWVRHPEIKVQLGVDAQISSKGDSYLVMGFRDAIVHSPPPYVWRFALVDVIPEWVTPVSSQSLTPRDPLRSKQMSGAILENHSRQKNVPYHYRSVGVSGNEKTTPFAFSYRYCRMLGYLQKCEQYSEVIDFTGIPVELKRDQRGCKYAIPKWPVVREAPSGARVQLVQQSRYLRGFEDKRWANLGLIIEIPEQAKLVSPLYRKYQRKPEINYSFRNEQSRTQDGPSTMWVLVGDSLYLVPVRLVRKGDQWVLPKFQVEFIHRVPVSERIPFDRVVAVRVWSRDGKVDSPKAIPRR